MSQPLEGEKAEETINKFLLGIRREKEDARDRNREREKPDDQRECCRKRKKTWSQSRISVEIEELSKLGIKPETSASIGEHSTPTPTQPN